MKVFTVACLLAITSSTVYAQAGIFRTYRDFMDDRVMKEYAEYLGAKHVLGKFKVSFKTESGHEDEIKIKKGKYWGYRTEEGLIYKINQKGDPFLMIERGVINVYVNFRSHFDEEGNLVVEYGSSFSPAFSEGDNGKMRLFAKRKLKKLVKDRGDAADLKALKQADHDLNSLLAFVEVFNKKYSAEEEKAAEKS